MRSSRFLLAVASAALLTPPATASAHGGGHDRDHSPRQSDLWRACDQALAPAKYIDLTHDLTPGAPVWKGFGPSAFAPTVNPETGNPYTYATDGFEATSYTFSTDQFGTQLDPPQAGRVDQRDDRDPVGVARLQEARGLVARVRHDRAHVVR
jgi:hypothetical protein